jgi:hypothetical protein
MRPGEHTRVDFSPPSHLLVVDGAVEVAVDLVRLGRLQWLNAVEAREAAILVERQPIHLCARKQKQNEHVHTRKSAKGMQMVLKYWSDLDGLGAEVDLFAAAEAGGGDEAVVAFDTVRAARRVLAVGLAGQVQVALPAAKVLLVPLLALRARERRVEDQLWERQRQREREMHKLLVSERMKDSSQERINHLVATGTARQELLAKAAAAVRAALIEAERVVNQPLLALQRIVCDSDSAWACHTH